MVFIFSYDPVTDPFFMILLPPISSASHPRDAVNLVHPFSATVRLL